jgi:hypothetical protein
MKRLIFTIILTIAFISVPYVDSADNNKGAQAGINKTADMMVLEEIKTVSLMSTPVKKIKTFETRKKTLGLNERISAYNITTGKKDKLFGLLLLAYGGKR